MTTSQGQEERMVLIVFGVVVVVGHEVTCVSFGPIIVLMLLLLCSSHGLANESAMTWL
jgi:hypothetical protein